MKGLKEKGVTLVALVVTIVMLIILAGITLGAITGDDGIIAKVKEAKRKTEIAGWEERIDLAIIEAESEKRNPTLEDVIDKLYDNDIIDDKENDVNRETGAITTNEPEYLIEGKLDDYLDNQGGTEPEEPPIYQEGDIIFSYSPSGEIATNKEVEVTITKNVEENYTIEYSKYDTNNWEEYTGPVNMEKNGAIYARLKNSSGISEKYATGNVTNIDKLPPNEPSISIGEITENSITVTASSTDKTATSEYANSGIKEYQFSKDNGESWEPSTVQASGTYTFTGLTEDTEYQIKVKVIDNAENETITENATSQKTESRGVTAGDIGNNGSIFGAEVKGYECVNSAAINKWLIFYVGTMGESTTSNIYLISSDYIPYEYIPYGTDNNGNLTSRKPGHGSSNYSRAAVFDDILIDYSGSSRIVDNRIKLLNNSYFNTKKYSSTYNNMKSVAYMLDTNAWSGYAGSKAEYAVGGPTLEILFKSYNDKYHTNYMAVATGILGYEVGTSESNLDVSLGLSNTNDLLYVITDRSNAAGCWLASPQNNRYTGDSNYVSYLYYNRRYKSRKFKSYLFWISTYSMFKI